MNSLQPAMLTPAEAIAAYIRAKDGNRPHLLDAAFAEEATLQMIVRTGAITFPALSTGRQAIAETLVRRFNQTYENIYTLCLGLPPAAGAETFSCDWLVAMSEKQSGAVRIGCGRYDWSFAAAQHQISALTITIETMETLSSKTLEAVMNWVSTLPYPWCDQQSLLATSPNLPEVRQVLQKLRIEGA